MIIPTCKLIALVRMVNSYCKFSFQFKEGDPVNDARASLICTTCIILYSMNT